MLDLPTVKSMTKLKLETLTLVNNKRSSCLLAVLQSALSEGCAELMVLSIKVWFSNWYQLSFLGTICTSGTSQWEWWCSFEGASTCDYWLTAPTNSPCTECPAVDVSWCRDHDAIGAGSFVILGLLLHGPVVKLNKAMHRCLRGQWRKREKKEKIDSSFLRMYV